MATLYASGLAGTAKTDSITDPSKAAWRRVLIAWAILIITMIAVKFPLIAEMRFSDPDDALRLVEVRDLLAGQSWFDVHQYRVAAPAGVAMHWSRLVDIPIAGMILMLRPLIGTHWAELATVLAIPALTLLCAQVLVARIATRFFNDDVAGLACVTFGLAVPVLWQFTPMRIDHHAWQIVLALAALNGLLARDAWRGGGVIGLALAASMAISIEGLPLAVLFLGVCALRGLRDPATRFVSLLASSGGLAVGSIMFFLGTRGTYDLVTHCDAISPVHLALFAWTAIGAAALHFASPRAFTSKLIGLAAIGAGAAAILFGAAPQCRGGTFVMLDPLVMRYWYPSVAEGMPFWHTSPPLAASIVIGPLVGIYGVFRLWRETPDPAVRAAWLDYMLVLIGAWLIGDMISRASATALVFAAVPTAALIMRWVYSLRTVPVVGRIGGYIGVIMLLVPPIPVVLATGLVSPPPANAEKGAMSQSHCKYNLAGRALDRLPTTDIFAPLDIGPDIIVKSHQRVVATGHHRGSAGMHDVIAAFMAPPEEAHSIVHSRRATLIVICPDIYEPSIYARRAPNGLMAQLLANRPPDWLERADLSPGSGFQFWRVVR